MPSIFSHAIASIALGKAYTRNQSLKFWLLAIFCSIIPDIDVVSFRFGINYSDLFGHRGFTHSIFFALLLAFLIVIIFFKEQQFLGKKFWSLTFFFFICTASHGFLDAMTSGGKGVAFFSPFSNERYFFTFHSIAVSPIGVTRFFSKEGIVVLKSEILWVWLPSILIISLAYFLRKNTTIQD